MTFPCLLCGKDVESGLHSSWGNANGRSLYIRTSKGVETWAVMCNQCLRMFDQLDLTLRSLFDYKRAVKFWNKIFPNDKRTYAGMVAEETAEDRTSAPQ